MKHENAWAATFPATRPRPRRRRVRTRPNSPRSRFLRSCRLNRSHARCRRREPLLRCARSRRTQFRRLSRLPLPLPSRPRPRPGLRGARCSTLSTTRFGTAPPTSVLGAGAPDCGRHDPSRQVERRPFVYVAAALAVSRASASRSSRTSMLTATKLSPEARCSNISWCCQPSVRAHRVSFRAWRVHSTRPSKSACARAWLDQLAG